MITIKNLTKQFHQQTVLDDISLSIPEHQIVAIIGPSGGGKSTLLRCINYLEVPEYGSVIIGQEEMNKKTMKKLRLRTGMLFQHFHLFHHMTVLENITYAPIYVKGESREEAIESAYTLLDAMGLRAKADALPHALSGGQKQRVAIVRLLAMSPDILLFDEPTSALDPENMKEVRSAIKNVVKTGKTTLIVTHDLVLAKSTADRVIFIDHGQVVEDQDASAFFSSPQSQRAKQFLDLMEA